MNYHSQKAYIDSIFPEVKHAIIQEYLPGQQYINAKYVSLRIINNPYDYPILSAKTQRHITDVVTTCISLKLGYPVRNKGGGHGRGRVFMREVK